VYRSIEIKRFTWFPPVSPVIPTVKKRKNLYLKNKNITFKKMIGLYHTSNKVSFYLHSINNPLFDYALHCFSQNRKYNKGKNKTTMIY
jgi:hypothetical protein